MGLVTAELAGVALHLLWWSRRRLNRQELHGPALEGLMNTDTLKGQWRQLKGEARTRWGKLTDDELDQVEGRAEKLVGLVQERYGYERERAEREVDAFLRRDTAGG